MEDRRTMSLALGAGQSQKILVEAGSTVLVVAGRVVLRGTLLWLAENMVVSEQVCETEQAWVAETTGWVEIAAQCSTQIVVIPPDAVSLWSRVGRCLEAIFGASSGPSLRKES